MEALERDLFQGALKQAFRRRMSPRETLKGTGWVPE